MLLLNPSLYMSSPDQRGGLTQKILHNKRYKTHVKDLVFSSAFFIYFFFHFFMDRFLKLHLAGLVCLGSFVLPEFLNMLLIVILSVAV